MARYRRLLGIQRVRILLEVLGRQGLVLCHRREVSRLPVVDSLEIVLERPRLLGVDRVDDEARAVLRMHLKRLVEASRTALASVARDVDGTQIVIAAGFKAATIVLKERRLLSRLPLVLHRRIRLHDVRDVVVLPACAQVTVV